MAWIRFLALVSALVVLVAQLGAFHPIGDTMAIAAPVAAVVGLFFGLSLGRGLWIPVLAICGSWVVFWGIDRVRDTGQGGDFVLYQKNIWAPNVHYEDLVADILASGADFVTLQEVADNREQIYDLLGSELGFKHHCRNSDWDGVGVVSRYPIVPDSGYCSPDRGLALAAFQTPRGVVWVGSIHLWWPFPFEQSKFAEPVLRTLEGLNGPVILGGDFNMFPGTRLTRLVAQSARVQELRPAFATMSLAEIPLPIDHVLAAGGRVEKRPLIGSDHHGLLAIVSIR